MEKKYTAPEAIGGFIGGVLVCIAKCIVFCLVFRWLCL